MNILSKIYNKCTRLFQPKKKYDPRYEMFGYSLSWSFIEVVKIVENGIDLYLSTDHMNVPETVKRTDPEYRYILSIRDIEHIESDFSIENYAKEIEKLYLNDNEVINYLFLDDFTYENQSPDALVLYFDTDLGGLLVAARTFSYRL